MLYRSSLLTLLFSLCLTACAGRPEHGKGAHDTFTTEIHSDGSKRFVLTMFHQRGKGDGGRDEGKHAGKKGEGDARSGKSRGGRGQSGTKRDNQQEFSLQNNRNGIGDDNRQAIIELVDEKITVTGYCRRGYIELSFSQMRDKTEMIGECQESASDEDKQQWD